MAIAGDMFAIFTPAYGNDAPRVAWLSDEAKRESGVKATRRMLAKERAGVAEIGKALAAEEIAAAAREGRR